MKKEAVGAFLKRYGWPIMGLLAAAPVASHALDWKSRALAKQKLKDERAFKAQEQLRRTQDIAPTGEDVYKAAAYARSLFLAEGRPSVEKLDLVDKALRKVKGQ
jgi:hypothetical protein